ncbi:MAG: gamma-glutamyl-gamma-aminobutyrate hydrolase family protein [Flavobacteriia bacterium]|nr:gamma-glutamyl-gamma-aminobutyrate hydrolase family protein [Flavobacteriia bacterium]
MIAVIDCGSQKTPLIESILYEHIDTKVISMLDLNPETDLSDCIGAVISGAPILITEKDPEPYLELFTWLKNTSIPVLGICFGHQMMGMTFGALANRQRDDRDWQTVEILVDCPLFDKLPTEVELMEDHCEAISIPAGFVHVGVSDSCVNEAMMHSTLPLYGVQFHPEVSGMHGAIVLEELIFY